MDRHEHREATPTGILGRSRAAFFEDEAAATRIPRRSNREHEAQRIGIGLEPSRLDERDYHRLLALGVRGGPPLASGTPK